MTTPKVRASLGSSTSQHVNLNLMINLNLKIDLARCLLCASV